MSVVVHPAATLETGECRKTGARRGMMIGEKFPQPFVRLAFRTVPAQQLAEFQGDKIVLCGQAGRQQLACVELDGRGTSWLGKFLAEIFEGQGGDGDPSKMLYGWESTGAEQALDNVIRSA
jgi:hypothetical protein